MAWGRLYGEEPVEGGLGRPNPLRVREGGGIWLCEETSKFESPVCLNIQVWREEHYKVQIVECPASHKVYLVLTARCNKV